MDLVAPFLMHDFLTATAARFPDKEALICGSGRWTYREIDEASTRLAESLVTLGVRRGDRVVLFLDNSAEAVIGLYGVLKAGATFVLVHFALKAKKLAHIIVDAGAKILITHVNKKGIWEEAAGSLPSGFKVVWVGDGPSPAANNSWLSYAWDDLVADGAESVHPKTGISKGSGNGCIDLDLAALIYTSGSTGEPKGVMCPHGSMVSVTRSIIQYLENTSDDIILNILPLSFGYGLYQVLAAFMIGSTVVLEKSFAFPVKVIERIPSERVTGFALVPTVAAVLLNMPTIAKTDFSSLRYITNAAAALPVPHIAQLRKLLPHVHIFSMYGQTECVRVCYLDPAEIDKRPASVGHAIPNCEVFVVDEQGERVGFGQPGELVVRGANVMRGYWNDPEMTAAAFRQGPYPGEILLHTGDLFRQDEEGYLYFVSRKDDLIKTRGERVSPKEVENALCAMEGVREAAVVGVPDEILGQAVKAFVARNQEAAVTEKEVLKYCASRLENFMMPKYIEFVSELPRTPNGKIDKQALKQK